MEYVNHFYGVRIVSDFTKVVFGCVCDDKEELLEALTHYIKQEYADDREVLIRIRRYKEKVG